MKGVMAALKSFASLRMTGWREQFGKVVLKV